MQNLSKPSSSYLEASKKEPPNAFFSKNEKKKNEMNLSCEYFLLFFSLFLKYYHTNTSRDVLLLLRVRVIGRIVLFFERRRRGGRGRPSGESGASGGASDERGLCVLFFLVLVFEFSSFFLPRSCVFVFPKGALNSLSLLLSLRSGGAFE